MVDVAVTLYTLYPPDGDPPEDVTPPENVAVLVSGILIITIPDPPLVVPPPPPPPVFADPLVPFAS